MASKKSEEKKLREFLKLHETEEVVNEMVEAKEKMKLREFLKLHEREEMEFKKVEKMIREKDEPKLEGWLKKFSGGWDFLAKPEREKFKKEDWL